MIVLFLLLPDLLVEQLSAEDIEARDQASEALRRIGEAALPGLRAERTVSDEVRSRIAWIVASIERETRRARFQGGNVVQGLRGAARVDKKEFALGEQGIVRFEIMNVSGTPVEFVPIRCLDETLPWGGGAYTSSHGLVEVVQLSGRRSSSAAASWAEEAARPAQP